MSAPHLRTAPLEWAWRAASGAAEGLRWVDPSVDPERPAYSRDAEGTAFRGEALEAHLPPPMVQAAAEASAAGQPTALEGLAMVQARASWLVRTRDLLWTPTTPVPELLARLVEAYGVDVEGHRGDPSILANLRAHLPGWHPHRGDAARALDVLDKALDEDLGVELGGNDVAGEVFACHDAAWWARREATGGALTVSDGVVRLQAGPGAPARPPEDVALAPRTDVGGSPRLLLRLLPAWTTPRLFSPRDA